jgi:hypothetical protein
MTSEDLGKIFDMELEAKLCGQKRPRKEHSDEAKEAMVIYSVVLVTGV